MIRMGNPFVTSGLTFQIDRIQNMTLFQQYQAKKKLLTLQNKQGTQNERILWQGTAPEAVDSINAHGFNRSFCSKNGKFIGKKNISGTQKNNNIICTCTSRED